MIYFAKFRFYVLYLYSQFIDYINNLCIMEEIIPAPAQSKTKEASEPAILSIKDCLRMIGVQEITANVFTLPVRKKVQATVS